MFHYSLVLNRVSLIWRYYYIVLSYVSLIWHYTSIDILYCIELCFMQNKSQIL